MKKSPWLYVPSLYFAEGLPYIIVNTVSAIIYKTMGMSNVFIGFTSILYLPWVIKMFWSPFVDMYKTKRSWIISTQIVLALLFTLLSYSFNTALFVPLTLFVFLAMAFISSTHDIAIDGYYMLALNKKEQAFFIGVRSTFYRISVIFGSGLLVVAAGTIQRQTNNIPLSWTLTLAVPAAMFILLFLFHNIYLPSPDRDMPFRDKSIMGSFKEPFRTYFTQDRIFAIVAFILLYRLGESMLVKMAAPFLLDTPSAGGLGLETDTVGYVYGTVGVMSLLAGGILGGWLISKYSLRKCIWPMALVLNAPNLFYVYMAAVQPSVETVYLMVASEQFGYGMGFTAFSVFMMYIAKEPYKTSHFAISTGLMALGMMLPGMISGAFQSLLGYTWFFVFVTILAIPGMVLIFFIPLDEIDVNKNTEVK